MRFLSLLTAVTAAIRAVGLLLVSALVVVPVAAARQVTRGFRATVGPAMAVGVIAAVGGPGRPAG